jgi:hypothetical protein
VALNSGRIIAAAISHVQTTGRFTTVNGHEPESAPAGTGLTAAVWVENLGPVPATSGLAVTSARVELSIRLFAPLQVDAPDAIDPALLDALDVLMASFNADFDLGGLVESVDLLGRAGTPLGARAGYVPQDQQALRVMTITLPLIVNDVWEQVA